MLVLCLVASACDGDADETSEATRSPAVEGGSLDFANVETIVGGLDVPWELAFVDDDTMLMSERPGRVRLVDEGRLRAEPVAEIDVRSSGEAGLLGLALHPEFPRERFAYVYYTSVGENRVSRFELDEEFGFDGEDVIVDGIPAAAIHDGGRIAFGPDGMLYIGTGDASEGSLAADRTSLAGKILRVSPDGSIPDDNPFPDSPVYSYGHRNIQGFDWNEDGTLYASEHGPTGEVGLCCHDEINEIDSGSFYGWPYRAGGARAEPGSGPADAVPPLVESGEETWAPAGVAFQRPNVLYVATLRGEELLRFELGGSGSPERQVAFDGFGRLRAARFGPDGCLYVTTSNTDGRGTQGDDDDRILRVCSQA